MKLYQYLAALLAFATLVPSILADSEDADDDGFFYFEDDIDWSQSAIYPQSCIETNDGPVVVYTLYNKNHNQCKKKARGTYKMGIGSFVKAYSRQMEKEYEAKGAEYEVDEDAFAYLECQQTYYNNQMYYMKVGCRNTGKGFQVKSYTDQYCTQQASSTYNMGVDISSLRVNFDNCKSCVATTYNQYSNNNNNNYYQNQNYYDNGSTNQHESMLCSSANYYKETCNRSCRRSAKKNSSGSSYGGNGFSAVGKVFLWILSISAIFFLLAGLAQRKKMSKQDALIEEAAIKSSGVDKKFIPRIFIGLILFVIVLILFKRKVLTWFFLVTVNIALLAYWMHLKNKAEQNAAVSGFQLYGESGGVAA